MGIFILARAVRDYSLRSLDRVQVGLLGSCVLGAVSIECGQASDRNEPSGEVATIGKGIGRPGEDETVLKEMGRGVSDEEKFNHNVVIQRGAIMWEAFCIELREL